MHSGTKSSEYVAIKNLLVSPHPSLRVSESSRVTTLTATCGSVRALAGWRTFD